MIIMTDSSPNIACFSCTTSWCAPKPIARSEECPKCRKDARVCLNCLNYDSAYHNDCKETQADFQSDKEKSNFCSYFNPLSDVAQPQTDEKDSAKDALSTLFGEPVGQGSPDTPDDAKTALANLFK